MLGEFETTRTHRLGSNPFLSLASEWAARATGPSLLRRIESLVACRPVPRTFAADLRAGLTESRWPASWGAETMGEAEELLWELGASRAGAGEPAFATDAAITFALLAARCGRGSFASGLPDPALVLATEACEIGGPAHLLAGVLCWRELALSFSPPEEGSAAAEDHRRYRATLAPVLDGVPPWCELAWPMVVTEALLGSKVAIEAGRRFLQRLETESTPHGYGDATRIWSPMLSRLGIAPRPPLGPGNTGID